MRNNIARVFARFLLLAGLLVGFFSSTHGCAFSEGSPWGYLDTTLELSRGDSPTHLLDVEYSIQVDTVRYSMETAGGTSGSTQFDPANPPPGYSLCHQGHCHADDGSLPSYEEVAEAMAQGSVPSTTLAGYSDIGQTLSHDAHASTHRVKISESGTITNVDIELSELKVSASIQSGDELLPLLIVFPVAGLRVATPIAVTVGKEFPEVQQVHLHISWPESILDDIDFDDLSRRNDGSILVASTANHEVAQALAERLISGLTLHLSP